MKSLFAIALLVASSFANQQPQEETPTPEVNWISVEEAYTLSQTTPKKIIIDVYTDWCGWCKRMDATTYSNATIVNYINDNFYAVKFDAEQKADVTINGTTYKYVGEGRRGYHELAAALLQGQMSYPSTVFLDEKFGMIQPVPGYMDAAGIEPILAFFATNAYKTKQWDEFQAEFKSAL